MKNFFTFIFLCLAVTSFGQKRFFGQAALTTRSKDTLTLIESQLKQNPSILVVRVDPLNFTVLVFTNEMEAFPIDRFREILGNYSTLVNCARVGEMQKDKIEAFPFRNCQ